MTTISANEAMARGIAGEEAEHKMDGDPDTIWDIETDADGRIVDFRYHNALDHDACCYLPLGCEGGCAQPGGCADPAGKEVVPMR